MQKKDLDIELIKKRQKLAYAGKYREYLAVINKALKKVKIKECNERMLFLPKHLRKDIFIKLVDLRIRAEDKKRLFLREGLI